jgi:parallel beta-helix repeat protein
VQGFGHCGSNRDQGVYLESGQDITLRNNVIIGNAARGIQLYTGDVGDSSGQYGVLKHVTIQGNLIESNGHDNYQDGISLDGAYPISDVRIIHNVAIDNDYSGVRFNSPKVTGIEISHNTFIRNGTRATQGSPSQINVDGGAGARAMIERNIFVNGPALLNACARTDGTFQLNDNVVFATNRTGPSGCVSNVVSADPQLHEGDYRPTNPVIVQYGAYSP